MNLGDAVQRLVDRHPSALRQVTEQAATHAAQALAGPPSACPVTALDTRSPTAPDTLLGAAAVPTRSTTATAQRFAAVKELQAQGAGQRTIARRLGLNRRKVQRYMAADQVPVRGLGRQMQSSARSYIPYLRRRGAEGEHNGVQLWQELRQQSYAGSYSSIYRLLRRLFGRSDHWGGARNVKTVAPHTGAGPLAPAAEIHPLSARQARWLIIRSVDELTAEDRQQRAWLLAACPAAATAAVLTRRFVHMVQERQGTALDAWLADALSSGVAELRNFATGLQRDYSAVYRRG